MSALPCNCAMSKDLLWRAMMMAWARRAGRTKRRKAGAPSIILHHIRYLVYSRSCCIFRYSRRGISLKLPWERRFKMSSVNHYCFHHFTYCFETSRVFYDESFERSLILKTRAFSWDCHSITVGVSHVRTIWGQAIKISGFHESSKLHEAIEGDGLTGNHSSITRSVEGFLENHRIERLQCS